MQHTSRLSVIASAAILIHWLGSYSTLAHEPYQEQVTRPKPLAPDAKRPIWWYAARCESFGDSLPQGQAQGRLEWSDRCALEKWTRAEKEQDLLESVRYSMLRAVISGARAQNEALQRKLYPTYGVVDKNQEFANPKSFQAPTQKEADCVMPPLYEVVGFCTEGCFASGQKLLFSSGEADIQHATLKHQEEAITLTADSDLDRFEYKKTPVVSFLRSLSQGAEPIIHLTTRSGKSLRVTQNHPLLMATGEMKNAGLLHIGDLLVGSDGSLDEITQISGETYFGKVHNVFLASENPVENLVVAEGLLSGSAWHQNQTTESLNRVLFRIRIPKNLVQ